MVNFSRQSHNAVVKWLWTVDKVTLFVAFALLLIGVILDHCLVCKLSGGFQYSVLLCFGVCFWEHCFLARKLKAHGGGFIYWVFLYSLRS